MWESTRIVITNLNVSFFGSKMCLACSTFYEGKYKQYVMIYKGLNIMWLLCMSVYGTFYEGK